MSIRTLLLLSAGFVAGCGGSGASPDADPTQPDASMLPDAGLPPSEVACPPTGWTAPAAGTTVYVETSGNDATGDGTAAAPWATVAHALTQVSAPATIHLGPGEFMQPTTLSFPPGISLEGSGEQTVIRSTITAPFTAIFDFGSPEGTVGAQQISNLRMDGDMTTEWALSIRGRSNVAVHDVLIENFFDRGIWWGGREDSGDGPPSTYATGNVLFNSTIRNSAHYDGYGRGGLNIGGQEGLVICGNQLSQRGRPAGQNGWPIKYANDGHLRGVKIYGNYIDKEPYDGLTWDFAIELFFVAGLEIFDNEIIGGVDLNHQAREGYPFSAHVHHNVIGPTALHTREENAITLEFSTEGAIVEHNHLRNVARAVYFTPRPDSVIQDVVIHRNIADNLGIADESLGGAAIRLDNGHLTFTVEDLRITHNVFIAAPGHEPWWGIELGGGASATGLDVRNNVINGFVAGGVVGSNSSAMTGVRIDHNAMRANGNANQPVWEGGAPTGLTVEANLQDADPLLDATFTPMLGSPLIDAGVDLGEVFTGAAPDIGAVERP